MPRPDDHAYYSHRAAQELECGDLATSAAIAAIHYELANRHSILAAQRGTQTPNLMLVEGGNRQLAA